MNEAVELVQHGQGVITGLIAAVLSSLTVCLVAFLGIFSYKWAYKRMMAFFEDEGSSADSAAVGNKLASEGYRYGGAGVWWRDDGAMVSGPSESGEIHHSDGTTEYPHGRDDIPDWWREEHGF